jgi:predicted DNA-binding transcriptional regulator
MTQDIIEMARKVGLVIDGNQSGFDDLAAFANFVAAKALVQRTWVGLAAEDRLTAKYMQDAPDGIEAVIDYLEAKLKEKNT